MGLKLASLAEIIAWWRSNVKCGGAADARILNQARCNAQAWWLSICLRRLGNAYLACRMGLVCLDGCRFLFALDCSKHCMGLLVDVAPGELNHLACMDTYDCFAGVRNGRAGLSSCVQSRELRNLGLNGDSIGLPSCIFLETKGRCENYKASLNSSPGSNSPTSSTLFRTEAP